MYGTVAFLRVKPGMQKHVEALARVFEAQIPGLVSEHFYRTDSDPNVYVMAVVFPSRDAYWTNAESREQDERYQKFRALLDEDPVWHDGEVPYWYPRP